MVHAQYSKASYQKIINLILKKSIDQKIDSLHVLNILNSSNHIRNKKITLKEIKKLIMVPVFEVDTLCYKNLHCNCQHTDFFNCLELKKTNNLQILIQTSKKGFYEIRDVWGSIQVFKKYNDFALHSIKYALKFEKSYDLFSIEGLIFGLKEYKFYHLDLKGIEFSFDPEQFNRGFRNNPCSD